MYLAAAVDNNSTDILAVANSPFLWACAIGVFPVIIIHSVIYMKAAQIAAPHIGMTHQEIKTSFRAGAISALGPSLAVVMVAVALLTVFGTPAVLVRIGLIGSVSYETAAAAIAANSAGAELGGPTYNPGSLRISPRRDDSRRCHVDDCHTDSHSPTQAR